MQIAIYTLTEIAFQKSKVTTEKHKPMYKNTHEQTHNKSFLPITTSYYNI